MNADFLAEVLRINDRYVGEFVEGFNLCPFAKLTRERGALFRRVFASDDLDGSLATLEVWEEETRLEIGMLIFPLTKLDPLRFDRFTQTMRERYEKPRGHGSKLILAPFHREAHFGQNTPAQMTMFWRRAPDPFIQVVPMALLKSVKGNSGNGKMLWDGTAAQLAEIERKSRHPSLSESIAKDNFELLKKPGLAALQATLASIYEDRDRSYARFLPTLGATVEAADATVTSR